jgi:uncharacterized protein YbjQ (UPF0145 family)
MRLFKGRDRSRESEKARQRRQASQHSIEEGGLPLNAIDRLQEQAARQGTSSHFFTSNLSVNELLLVRQAGFEPLGQVMGSSVHFLTGPFSSGISGELTFLTQAYHEGQGLALGRLQQEVELLGATGVVGVRLQRKKYRWGEGLMEFTAIGTAVRETHPARPASKTTAPFLSALSGQELWTLKQAGYRPLGLVIGECVYYKVGSIANAFNYGTNWERPDYTQALYNARALAMGRMEAEARALGAQGVVGVTMDIFQHRGEDSANATDMFCHFLVIGTAVTLSTGSRPNLSLSQNLSLK